MYELAALEAAEVETVTVVDPLNHGLFLRPLPGGESVVTSYDAVYGKNAAYVRHLTDAEQAFQDGNIALARELYLKVLEIAPDQSQVMTYLGQTYEREGEHATAKEWYRKAIAANYHDYMAHWFLADNLSVGGDADGAVREILIARVLNRTNMRLSDAVDRVLGASGLAYDDWDFSPRYEVAKAGGHKVSVKYDGRRHEWLAYALCKAVWAFEPGYRDSMLLGSNEHPRMVEEKECVVNVLIAVENSKEETSDPALRAARTALDEKVFSQFLIYDVILPGQPGFVFNLAESSVEQIARYVLKYRTRPS